MVDILAGSIQHVYDKIITDSTNISEEWVMAGCCSRLIALGLT